MNYSLPPSDFALHYEKGKLTMTLSQSFLRVYKGLDSDLRVSIGDKLRGILESFKGEDTTIEQVSAKVQAEIDSIRSAGVLPLTPPEFMDFFPEHTSYPRSLAYDLLPLGRLYNYVDSDFLSGFTRHLDVVSGYVLNRYHDWEEDLTDAEETISIRPNLGPWKAVPVTSKNQVFDVLTRCLDYIGKLSDFQDDVVLLAKAPTDDRTADTMWYYLWFDQDCSDCSIGRFSTSSPELSVRQRFDTYVTTVLGTKFNFDPDVSTGGPRQIPLNFFQTRKGMTW